MDFGHHNIQRISKAFTLNPNNNIDDPCISLWNKTTLTLLKSKKSEYYNVICSVIDRMGDASAKAQVLPTAITTSSKIQFNDNNLYLYSVDSKACGILKVGRKKLFYRSMTGDFKEIEPLCVLDFYVSEAIQRKGIGKILFEAMLSFEKTSPERLAYDRPSPKLIGFLRRHYGLSDYIPQSNNFVVFKQYFMSGASIMVPNPTISSSNEVSSQRPPLKRNDSDLTAITPITMSTIDSRALNQPEPSINSNSQNEYSPQTGYSTQNNYSSPQYNNYSSPQGNYSQYPPQTNYSSPQGNNGQYPIQSANKSPQNNNPAVQYRTANNQSPMQYRSPSSQNVYASPQYSSPPPVYKSPTSYNNQPQPFRSPSSQSFYSSNPQNFYTTTAQSFYSQNGLATPSPNKRFVQYNPITHECAEIERNGDSRKTGKKLSSSKLSGY